MTRTEKRLLQAVGRASRDFDLIEPGDRILVGLSGGKDSYAMMHLLAGIRQKTPFSFELVGVNLDQGHPGFEQHVIAEWCESNGYENRMLREDTYRIVLEKIPEGKTYCSLCSRLRRGVLYNAAVDLGCNKVALGHHRDDFIETLLLNLLYSGSVKSMAPRLVSDDGRNVVIRPLVYCDESDLVALADEQSFPILPCDLCGSQEDLQRKAVKKLIRDLNDKNPNVRGNLFAALSNVVPSHLLLPHAKPNAARIPA